MLEKAATLLAHDFKGNIIFSRKQFTQDYNMAPNWEDNVNLLNEQFVTQTAYDALGNILSDHRKTYQYNTHNNFLLGNDNIANQFTYDEHGNMLTMPHLSSMAWDYEDRLFSAGNGTFASYYNYDIEGNRTRKVVDKGSTIETRYYVNGYELYKKEGTTNIKRKTVNIADDEKVFVRIEQETEQNEMVVRYQYDNHLGSACLELAANGDIISYEEYHPFGTTSYRAGRTETEVSLKRYKYNGKERDEETGLYAYGMRYYAAWICRFVSVDPLQFEYPELTPFQYASNRPISATDLDGEEAKIAIYGAGIKTDEEGKIIEKHHSYQFKSEAKEQKEQENADTVEAVFTGSALKEILQTATQEKGTIEYLFIASHASSSFIIMDNGENGREIVGRYEYAKKWTRFTNTEFSEIFENENITFSDDALIVIAGCRAGNTFNSDGQKIYSIAEDIATQTGVATIGTVGSTTPTKLGRKADVEYKLFYKNENGNMQEQSLGKTLNKEAINKAKGIISNVQNIINKRNENPD